MRDIGKISIFFSLEKIEVFMGQSSKKMQVLMFNDAHPPALFLMTILK